MKFLTKAATLKTLENNLKFSKVLPQYSFTLDDLRKNKTEILQQINAQFGSSPVIIRSSGVNEDTSNSSLAGKFLSLLNIKDIKEIENGIEDVIKGFGSDQDPNNVIFIQPMLENISLSGVLFTLDPVSLGNYYVINYDDNTGSSDSITSGTGKNTKLFYSLKSKPVTNNQMSNIIAMAKELEDLFNNPAIDIEFAISNSQLYLLQVRPLVLRDKPCSLDNQKLILEQIENKLANLTKPHPYLYGKRSIFGVMPDWNPAEIIGLRPKSLALSLYKYLITDGTWAYQRSNYGYKNLRSFPLMVDFGGLPYIDVRISFNSFLPKELDDALSQKLSDFYLDSLAQSPDKHDKVEFEIILSCFTFNMEKGLTRLKEGGFTQEECDNLSSGLLKLTNNIINVKDGLWISDSERIETLKIQHNKIINSDLDDLSKIYWLLEDCKRYGTLPFAGLARAGFIAVQLMKSLVEINLLTEEEYSAYMGELSTVSSLMGIDHKELSKEAFLRKYGHLRPGTYDITSPRYDKAGDRYFGEALKLEPNKEHKEFRLSLDQYSRIDALMKEKGFTGDVLSLFKFIKAAIEGREYSKFIFTKSLSDALELIANIGKNYSISIEDIAYMDINDLMQHYPASANIKDIMLESIKKGKEKYASSLTLNLPPVIIEPQDIYEFHLPDATANFITLKEASGYLETDLTKDLRGKILLISAADPGYDWIFSQGIAGFITAYGGANSHMAIRAGELELPAVIGIGEKMYNQLSKENRVRIDCSVKKIEII